MNSTQPQETPSELTPLELAERAKAEGIKDTVQALVNRNKLEELTGGIAIMQFKKEQDAQRKLRRAEDTAASKAAGWAAPVSEDEADGMGDEFVLGNKSITHIYNPPSESSVSTPTNAKKGLGKLAKIALIGGLTAAGLGGAGWGALAVLDRLKSVEKQIETNTYDYRIGEPIIE